jgi:hypothetical protein
MSTSLKAFNVLAAGPQLPALTAVSYLSMTSEIRLASGFRLSTLVTTRSE